VDEVHENISQKGDGNAGGQKFVVATNMRAQVQNSFNDNHFTVLGFTVADGYPVMCAMSCCLLDCLAKAHPPYAKKALEECGLQSTDQLLDLVFPLFPPCFPLLVSPCHHACSRLVQPYAKEAMMEGY
jgi:hypothetical protein